MKGAQRYHPFLILYHLWKAIKGSIFLVIYLFVINSDSESKLVTYGRPLFLAACVFTLISIIFRWFTHKYELDDKAFHLYKGLFNRSERTIPFTKIQNVNRHISLFHRLFHVTLLRFETGMGGKEAAVQFEVISRADADRMEAYIKSSISTDMTAAVAGHIEGEDDSQELPAERHTRNRTIHFTPTKKDMVKAFFTSLSFLVFVPVLISFYFKINDVFHVEKETESIFLKLMNSGWMVTVIIILLVLASAAFGIGRTYLKYSKYEISSDQERIYIAKGVIDETAFSIAKEKVQAVEITQSMMKRALGLAEVKLISAGGLNIGEDSLEINSLYPFLPIQRAYEMISEILPSYEVTQKMNQLPRKSLWMHLLRPSWMWILTGIVLCYFQPTILRVEQAWWILSILVFVVITARSVMNFLNTRYIIKDQFIQFKQGSLTTSLFLSKREKVIEIQVTRSVIQKTLKLASVQTVNRAKPLFRAGIKDVPIELAEAFYKWYLARGEEVEVEVEVEG